jgi:hypothetical protein
MAPGLLFDHSTSNGTTEQQCISKLDNAATSEKRPQLLDGPLTWTGSHYDEGQHTYCLTAEEKVEIEAALAHFKSIQPSRLAPSLMLTTTQVLSLMATKYPR